MCSPSLAVIPLKAPQTLSHVTKPHPLNPAANSARIRVVPKTRGGQQAGSSQMSCRGAGAGVPLTAQLHHSRLVLGISVAQLRQVLPIGDPLEAIDKRDSPVRPTVPRGVARIRLSPPVAPADRAPGERLVSRAALSLHPDGP